MTIKHFVIENTWLTGMAHGWGNGYVAIPKGHPCFGMDYDEIHDNYEINAHGGLTFASHVSNNEDTAWPVPDDCVGHWIVGFDTGHYGDNALNWPKLAVEAEAQRLAKQFEAIV